MKPNLTQHQRIIVSIIYLFLLIFIFKSVGGKVSGFIWNPNIDSAIWFYSAALMIILGSYIVEPYFTKPSDAIANSTAVLIALFGLTDKSAFWGYGYILYFSLAILLLSVFAVFSKDSTNTFLKIINGISYWITETFGRSKFIFSVIYLAAAYSYFAKPEKIVEFITIISFWLCITFFDIVGYAVERFSKLIKYFRGEIGDDLGQAIGCDNPLLYKVEVDSTKEIEFGNIVAIETSLNSGSVGMVVNSKQLLNKRWLNIYLLQDKQNAILKINLKTKKLNSDPKSLFTHQNSVYLLDINEIGKEVKEIIEGNYLYKNKLNFVGYVSNGSNINTINFSILQDNEKSPLQISEGVILKTAIYGKGVLYQVINGNTQEERLENLDTHGFTIGIARKLGRYITESKELDVSKWMPIIYSPLFFAFTGIVEEEQIKQMAQTSIGRLPDTNLEIPIKDIEAIVTHNTAILGILGIGKSCLAYELIKKISEHGVKIICIDITNEYKKNLGNYVPREKIDFDVETAFNSINEKYEYVHLEPNPNGPGKDKIANYEKSGNKKDYEKLIENDLCNFLFNQETIPNDKTIRSSKSIRIFNPDYHKVSKGEKIGFNTITVELTQAEKTQIIATKIFKILMNLGTSAESKARVLIVFEEAHSLIPEWNSVASEGDKTATNGTAKVILQGRKYGLGSLVITQRTANVSKSILNQCNTIFALRVFDDTGKSFLENYIGADYSNTLPTLEERHAIAIGKGLKLKQPVIIQLNDKKYVTF